MPCETIVSVVADAIDGVYVEVPRKLRRRLVEPCELTLQKASARLFATSNVVALNGCENAIVILTGWCCGSPSDVTEVTWNVLAPVLLLGMG